MRLDSASGRWLLAVAVLGSGIAFLDATVVNVALPDIGRDLHASTSTLQSILNGYVLTLAALVLLVGSLGDHYGRRRIFAYAHRSVHGGLVALCGCAECGAARGREACAGGRRGPSDTGQPGDDRVRLSPR